ncbi:MAG: phosphomevalonate kinase [Atopococcus tabaci]|uniref:phosphomevalonate kinase n=1 Tax=Atopococcus tabaci TaxID=269774 RepID=A0AA43ZRH3_9LACT|nr:phosphomevalonate kinase [Atopococcus tabaci]
MASYVKVPGKLYLAGEYAVTYPYHSALVFAVDRFLTVKITPSDQEKGTFQSTSYQDKPLDWYRQKGIFTFNNDKDYLKLIESAVLTTEEYLAELGKSLTYYHIGIESQLDSQSGQKYGLGSSGAVTVGLVQALLDYYQADSDKETIFKLSVLSQLKIGKEGSFGDIAASTYTGCIHYTCFDKKAIKEKLFAGNLLTLVKEEWPGFHIRTIELEDYLQIGVGWTGSPASTDELIEKMHQENTSEFVMEDFLRKNEENNKELIYHLENGPFEGIGKNIQTSRQLLKELGQARQISIETPLLTRFIEITEKHRAFAKTSGAGGGDCGVALFDCTLCKQLVEKEWLANGIEPLDLTIYNNH